MDHNEDLKHVFTGSSVDSGFIKEMLEESGIGVLVRDTLRESLVAGFVSGAQEDSSLVYVATIHYEEAKKLIKEYLDTIQENPE